MISAQDLIEKITSAATCDDCIVVVKDKTQANLRWAASTLTTNGVITERSVTVIAFIAQDGGMASGGVTRTDVNEADIPHVLEQAIAAAKAAGKAEDFAPLAKNVSLGDWDARHVPTGQRSSMTLLQHLVTCLHDPLEIASNSLVTLNTHMKQRGLAQKAECVCAKIHLLVALK
jgi:hypothetical protein